MSVQRSGSERQTRASLVDGAEREVRRWLDSGRFRPGDRLPTEEQLAGMLGISRGTLRSALRRLESSDEIERRQGSGTFVGVRNDLPSALGPWLRTDGYVQRPAHEPMSVSAVEIDRSPVDATAAAALDLAVGARALLIRRVLRAGDRPMAATVDVLHPDLRVPDVDAMLTDLRRGHSVHAMLAAFSGIAFAASRMRIDCRLVEPTDGWGRRLELEATAACLTQEVASTIGGRAIRYGYRVLAPGQVEIAVAQSAGRGEPQPIVGRELTPAD